MSREKLYMTVMMLAPHAKINDGLLDIIIIKGMSRIEVLKNIGSIYKGKHLSNPCLPAGKAKIIELTGKEITVISREKVFIEMDGELTGMLDAKIRVLPKEMNFIV